MAIVTIGGPRGGGREDLGRAVAQLLGAELVDRDAMAREAQRLAGASREEISRRFEQGRTGSRLARAMRAYLESSAMAGSAADPFLGAAVAEILISRSLTEASAPAASAKDKLGDKRYLEILANVTKGIAALGNVVFIGGGSQLILREHLQALRVCATAPAEARARRVMEAENVDMPTAQRILKEADEARRAWLKKFFDAKVDDPYTYDIVVNTALLQIDVTAPLLVEAACVKELSCPT